MWIFTFEGRFVETYLRSILAIALLLHISDDRKKALRAMEVFQILDFTEARYPVSIIRRRVILSLDFLGVRKQICLCPTT